MSLEVLHEQGATTEIEDQATGWRIDKIFHEMFPPIRISTIKKWPFPPLRLSNLCDGIHPPFTVRYTRTGRTFLP